MDGPRRISHFFAGFLLFACLATSASAVPVAVVGSVDPLIASSRLANSGSATEESWVSDVLGFTVDIDFRDNATASAGWELVNGSEDHWAHSLAIDPTYFVLKLGVGNSGSDTHYLYENLSALSWAVIDLSNLLAGQNLNFNFGRISHISEFDASTSLPEPGSFGLFIIGFGLFGWMRRKPT